MVSEASAWNRESGSLGNWRRPRSTSGFASPQPMHYAPYSHSQTYMTLQPYISFVCVRVFVDMIYGVASGCMQTALGSNPKGLHAPRAIISYIHLRGKVIPFLVLGSSLSLRTFRACWLIFVCALQNPFVHSCPCRIRLPSPRTISESFCSSFLFRGGIVLVCVIFSAAINPLTPLR